MDSTPASGPSRSRPDVVLVLIDTLRRDHLDVYGYENDTTEYLERLAARSVVFERARSTSSWTAPAAASVITGFHPSRHGIVTGMHNYVWTRKTSEDPDTLVLSTLPTSEPTLAELFQTAGYETFGISSNVNFAAARGFDRGFDRFANQQRSGAHELADEILSWAAERDGDRPAFWYLHFNDVHSPYEGHAPWYEPKAESSAGPDLENGLENGLENDLEDLIARYDSEIRFVDEALGRLHEELSWDENTVIVVLADHGEEFMDHGRVGHRFQLYGELVDIPFMIHVPHQTGEQAGGLRRTEPVSLVDVVPTLAELAGLPVDSRDGQSLVPLLTKTSEESEPASRAVFAHRFLKGRQEELWAVIKDGWKLILHTPKNELQLFDLAHDPQERRNVAPDEPARVQALLSELRELQSLAPLPAGEMRIELGDEMRAELEALGYAGEED